MTHTDEVHASAQTLELVPLDQIQASSTNPRKRFDPAYIAELAGSIRTVGVLEPLLVRRLERAKKGGPLYELVAGECRFRAAKLTDYPSVPCVIRTLTDVQVLEHQVIENLQRQDLHPLEEADGYRQLMTTGKYDVEALAKRVHKSAKYIYDRVKLLQLTPDLQKTFLDGQITAAHAVILARLKPADQKRAADRNSGGLWQSEGAEEYLFTAEEMKAGAADDPLKPHTSRELQSWVDQHVRFEPKDADPMLFPETAAALESVQQDKVVAITFEHFVQPDARTNARIFGPRTWKRADGEIWEDPTRHSGKAENSKPCEKSRLGMVVAGERRGEAFQVCVSKSCEVHWPAQVKKAKAKTQANGTGVAKVDPWQVRQEREEKARAARLASWREVLPDVKTAVAEAVKKASATSSGVLVAMITQEMRLYGDMSGHHLIPLGRTAEDFLRHQAFRVFLRIANGNAYTFQGAVKMAEKLGVDVKKIAKAAAAKKPAAAAPAKKPAKAKSKRSKGSKR